MNSQDIRWIQRFKHFTKALLQLEQAVELSRTRALSDLEKQGLIQAFEYTHELAWKTLKDFLEDKGVYNLYGSRDSTREAFKRGLIDDGKVWMDMIKSRNLSSYTYNQEIADAIAGRIVERYVTAFQQLLNRLNIIAEEERA
ncbi:nucleotidyltransferase substrate binding protein [Chloroflexus sp.]|uniref:nucleotidyltransferase substrate binding protein n=1 Tax=Chloroflexus sp. TaxID=1904827 RepID=UPI002ADDEF30|nr:nucleotidyltransferase substrate binding protein [Chloroflexus sp.]